MSVFLEALIEEYNLRLRIVISANFTSYCVLLINHAENSMTWGASHGRTGSSIFFLHIPLCDGFMPKKFRSDKLSGL